MRRTLYVQVLSKTKINGMGKCHFRDDWTSVWIGMRRGGGGGGGISGSFYRGSNEMCL